MTNSELFIIWFIGTTLVLIVMIARYYILCSKGPLVDYMFEGLVQYAVFWFVCIPAHAFLAFIIWAGKALARSTIGKAIEIKAANKDMVK